MEVAWEDLEYSVDDCATICKKDRLTVFRIMEARDCYYADYYNNRLFNSPKLTYYEAAQIAKEKFGNDSLENRLVVAKEFFLKNYKEQVFKTRLELNRMDICG